jgi:hypothetical protein
MDKREFMGAVAVAGAAPAAFAAPAANRRHGPTLLTITGAVGRSNRGPFDPATDIMMGKHKLAFTKAFAFDFEALSALPAITIKPTLEYDSKPHTLRGPLLMDVLAAAGVHAGEQTRLALRAVDVYAATISAVQARAQRFIVATHLDGQAMALGGLGPLWAVLDADRLPALAAKPLAERFANCPWGLYHIEVTEAKNTTLTALLP